ncbi:hypothetical protein LshimejAT787_0405950 [Lyophyllum shimeji]|uniref:Uncharacterized protein n=1 Tax=Lyophyllum shimeji TaxID=47721 RepID=A0A9P3PLD0_LYOSH|nr:hypothetical protein LshimejAT787_0405950 [Lyophyllum shimeji]
MLTSIRSINDSLIGQKLRLMGRQLSYDSTTGLILLFDANKGVLVDVSLCVNYLSGSWLREHLSTIGVIGYLEASSEKLPIPTLPTHTAAPALDPTLVIRALLVEHAPDIDMDLWNMAIEERERSR